MRGGRLLGGVGTYPHSRGVDQRPAEGAKERRERRKPDGARHQPREERGEQADRERRSHQPPSRTEITPGGRKRQADEVGRRPHSENARFRGVTLLPRRGGEAMVEQASD